MASLQERLSRDDKMREGLMRLRIRLDERSDDLSVFSEVTKEGVAAPPAFLANNTRCIRKDGTRKLPD